MISSGNNDTFRESVPYCHDEGRVVRKRSPYSFGLPFTTWRTRNSFHLPPTYLNPELHLAPESYVPTLPYSLANLMSCQRLLSSTSGKVPPRTSEMRRYLERYRVVTMSEEEIGCAHLNISGRDTDESQVHTYQVFSPTNTTTSSPFSFHYNTKPRSIRKR